MTYDSIFCSSENTPAYTTIAANEGVIKGIIVKLLPRWFRYGIWTAQKPYSDKWREYGARAKEAPCFILWLNNHYRGIANQNWIKLIVINNSPQIFGLSSDLCPNTLTGMVNFDWVNGWKCWTLASKNVVWRRVTQELRNEGPLEMLSIAKPVKIKVLWHQFSNLMFNLHYVPF